MVLANIALLILALFSSTTSSIDLSISHINTKASLFYHPNLIPPTSNWVENVVHLASNDPSRIHHLSSIQKQTSSPVASGQHMHVGNYVVRAKIGTPAQLMFMILDISGDTTWVPCRACDGCKSTVFNSRMSETYGLYYCSMPECNQVRGAANRFACPADDHNTLCNFNQTYGNGNVTATFSRDYLRLDNDIIPNYAFGCVNNASGTDLPTQGLLGLGRGPFSLFSQSGSLYSGIFSYCLPSFSSFSFSGSLKLGPRGQPKKIRTTRLLINPHRPSLHYVNMIGIRVGGTEVPIDPKFLNFNSESGAGTIIDSGTVISRFVGAVYNATRDEFRKQVKGPFTSNGLFDTCFATEEAVLNPPPRIVLMFEDMRLKLPLENSFVNLGNVTCLAMAASPSNINTGFNIIGNLQQQNLRILIDIKNSRVGIKREVCN